MPETYETYVARLNRRIERFNKELEINAPDIIKTNELRLIIDACNTLLDFTKGIN